MGNLKRFDMLLYIYNFSYKERLHGDSGLTSGSRKR